MFHLTTIGDALMDLFFLLDEQNPCCRLDKNKKQLCFLYGEKMSIQESAVGVGGNAANVAVGARKLGLTTSIVTSLGDDINGHFIGETLERAGVDTQRIQWQRNSATRYSVVLTYQAERTILSYHGKKSYRLPRRMSKSQWMYYTSMGAGFEALQKSLESYLEAHPEVRLAMNPGSYQIRFGLSLIKRILPRASALFLNKEEAELIAGQGEPKRLMSRLAKMGPQWIFITDGENGSYGSDGKTSLFLPVYPIPAVSKTGAGDAYTSGALSAILKGKHLAEAMQWGNANAASVIQNIGAEEGLATRAQIRKIIRRFPSITPKNI